jgi:uncharacterized protein YdhG (YjbR/CyaY superfamily)
MATVQDYLKNNTTASQRVQYERVEKIVKKLVPETEVVMSYGIPTFKYKGKYLIYFAAFKDHMSVYPTVGVVEATKGTKGTFQFTEDKPVPESIVKAIVLNRVAYIDTKG